MAGGGQAGRREINIASVGQQKTRSTMSIVFRASKTHVLSTMHHPMLLRHSFLPASDWMSDAVTGAVRPLGDWLTAGAAE